MTKARIRQAKSRLSARDRAIARARDIIRPSLHHIYIPEIERGEWPLHAVDTQDCIKLLEALWPIVPKPERPKLLAEAISGGDLMAPHLRFLLKALRAVRSDGGRVFGSDEDRLVYEALPDPVQVYRGTVQAERDQRFFGICWTTDRDRAVWFATEHGRFRNTASPPILMAMHCPKDLIVGVIFDRGESELLIDTATAWRAADAGALAVQSLAPFLRIEETPAQI
jgi:hypothetical protein